mmetsp:Transcript_66891/g.157657  ORF Transcript_66891/g.157657 Transcript_66891/m.157657 type:complete len:468 (-) Transcript_66891:378-1781(-)
MLYYSTESWYAQIVRWQGTIWGEVKTKAILIGLYLGGAYWLCVHRGEDLGRTRHNILGSTISFLLIFRANNAYKRFMLGRAACIRFFSILREIICTYIVFLAGGTRNRRLRWRRVGPSSNHVTKEDTHMDVDDAIASEERTEAVRWCLIMAIAFQMHTRLLDQGFNKGRLTLDTKRKVDWDRYRIRGLTSESEFRSLDHVVRAIASPQSMWDEPRYSDLPDVKDLFQDPDEQDDDAEIQISRVPYVRLCTYLVYKLNEVGYRNMNDPRMQDKRWGMGERFVPLVTAQTMALSHAYSEVTQIVSTPLPFPYNHLCKSLLFVFFLSFPFLIQQELGIWVNVVENALLAVALLGLDAIATELENPFGEDANDLQMYDRIATLEQEVMVFVKLCGDDSCLQNFIWQEFPKEIYQGMPPVTKFLALRSQVDSQGREADVIWGGSCSREHIYEGMRDLAEEDEEVDAAFSDDS